MKLSTVCVVFAGNQVAGLPDSMAAKGVLLLTMTDVVALVTSPAGSVFAAFSVGRVTLSSVFTSCSRINVSPGGTAVFKWRRWC
jgi:hypothetical protein